MVILFSLWWFLAGIFHALYLSTCQVTIHADRAWEGHLRLFYDDLEDALQHRFGVRPDLSEGQLDYHRGKMETYLKEHLVFQIGQSHTNYLIKRTERHNDVVEIIIQGSGWPVKSMTIHNSLLMELFETQKNVMIIKSAADTGTLYFHKGSTDLDLQTL
jgi:hypothetical protein